MDVGSAGNAGAITSEISEYFGMCYNAALAGYGLSGELFTNFFDGLYHGRRLSKLCLSTCIIHL